MKYHRFLTVFPLALVALAILVHLTLGAGSADAFDPQSDPADLIAGSFNIRYTTPGETFLRWSDRRSSVVEAIRTMDAHVIALQEVRTFDRSGRPNEPNVQLDWLRSRLPDYRFAAVGDPRYYPTTQPIAYRGDRLSALEQGFFFFGPDPDRLYSPPWEARFPAFASWVYFEDIERGVRFTVYNVHLDVQSRTNRRRASQLLAERVSLGPHPEDPVIIVGDFNAVAFTESLAILHRAGFQRARVRGSTFHFGRGFNLFPAIDHLLVSSRIRAGRTRVIRRRFDSQWPSDHYPFAVELHYEQSEAKTDDTTPG